MAKKKIYKHHQRTTTALAKADAVTRELVLASDHRKAGIKFADGNWLPLVDTFHVTAFGAVGDGVTDDTAAIQAAIAAALPVGGTVYFPSGTYNFTSQISIDTSSSLKVVTLQGDSMWSTVLSYSGSVSPAVKIGTTGGTLDNSGFVNVLDIQIYGASAVGAVDAIHGRKGQRYSYWNNVLARGFASGTGITLENYWLIGWGNLYSISNNRGFVGEVLNACKFGTLHIEGCGPASPSTVPSCYIQGQGTTFDVVSIEANLAINTLRIEDEITIGHYYSESNLAPSTGNEVSLRGEKPCILGAMIYPGTYGAPPNPRYILGMGDSVNARVFNFEVRHTLPDPLNTTYGVDFETSDNSVVDFVFQSYEGGISQEVARNQSFKGNLNRFTLNGVRYAAGMPVEALGRLLLEGYNEIPVEVGLMQRPGSTLRALGFTADNLSADSVLKKFPSPLGGGRVQKVERDTVTGAGLYYRINSGVLSATDKYFISSYVHRTSASGTAQLRVLNGATDQLWSPLTENWIGWQRISNVRTLANAGSSNVDFWPCYINSGAVHHTCGLMVINLTQFDTDYGTSIADLPVLELEQILDPRLLSNLFREYARNAVPTDGTYTIGDRVWYFPPAAGGKDGAICIADGTPGTWLEIGEIPFTYSGTWDPGNMAADGNVVSTSVTVTGATMTDRVQASLSSIGTNNVLLSAHVESANTVRVVLQNKTGGALDIASGTLNVRVFR